MLNVNDRDLERVNIDFLTASSKTNWRSNINVENNICGFPKLESAWKKSGWTGLDLRKLKLALLRKFAGLEGASVFCLRPPPDWRILSILRCSMQQYADASSGSQRK